jgi:hypothetical protein
MFTVHATKKLLERLKTPLSPPEPAPTTQLGNWYATVLFWKPQVVLFVNETTLLPVLVPLAPASTVISRLPDAIAEVLEALGIPTTVIDAELAAMNEVNVSKTGNRSVVGMLNEFSFLGDRWSNRGTETDLLALSLRLAETPCGPLYKSTSCPNSEVRLRLLGEVPKHVQHQWDRQNQTKTAVSDDPSQPST